MSRVEATYCNAFIHGSTTALLGDQGVQTQVLFQMLIGKFTWGRYRCQPLHVALQQTPLPANGNGKQKLTPQPLPPGVANTIGSNQG